MARRAGGGDAETTSAIEELVRARAAGLYALGAKVRELADARRAVTAAQDAERALHVEAMQLQEQAVKAGWALDELRQAGLFVAAPALVRRRRRAASPAVAPQDAAAPGAAPAASAVTPLEASGACDGQASPDGRDDTAPAVGAAVDSAAVLH